MDTYVLGVFMHEAATHVADKRLEEMVFDTAHATLAAAQVSREELDHVTIAACDELDGRSISSMLLAAPSGAYLKDELKVTDSGLVGLCMEALRIESGRFQLGLLVSWNKSSTAPFEDVMRMRCDPFYTRPIGLNMTVADALFAQTVAERYGITDDEVGAAVHAAYRRAAGNPRGLAHIVPALGAIAGSDYVATPLRRAHQAPLSDGAVGMVLCSGAWLARHPGRTPLARLAGAAWSVDAYQLGGERLAGLAGFGKSFDRALAMSGLEDASALDVIELDTPTGYHELAYRRALPLAATSAVCPSGGAFAQNPYFCSGLVNAAEAALQVAGCAGPVQKPGAQWAGAHGCHGFAQQGNAVAIFEGV